MRLKIMGEREKFRKYDFYHTSHKDESYFAEHTKREKNRWNFRIIEAPCQLRKKTNSLIGNSLAPHISLIAAKFIPSEWSESADISSKKHIVEIRISIR